MQNKFLYQILCVSFVALLATPVLAQEADDFLAPAEDTLGQITPDEVVQPVIQPVQVTEPAQPPVAEVMPDLTGKQAVDFPGRTSLDTLELAPLPGIYETDITGPAPLAPSVSTKDMPSERLLGRLTPEVFQEMAELERDNTFLKLQIQKATMKNDLEKLRANYRQARLDEIAKREDVVRTRIQWWQEQEKIRQDLEAQRAAAENMKAESEEQKAAEAVAAETDADDIPEEIEKQVVKEEQPAKPVYALLGISGIRDTLTARIKNIETGRMATIEVGDSLTDGSVVDSIEPTQVILKKNNKRSTLTFEDM